jgi:hypothetical protein
MWAQASVIFNSTAMLARSALGSQRSRPRFKPGRVFAAILSIREQGISKAGNHRARKLAVELSWLGSGTNRASDLSRWFGERVGDVKGRIRRNAILAMTPS